MRCAPVCRTLFRALVNFGSCARSIRDLPPACRRDIWVLVPNASTKADQFRRLAFKPRASRFCCAYASHRDTRRILAGASIRVINCFIVARSRVRLRRVRKPTTLNRNFALSGGAHFAPIEFHALTQLHTDNVAERTHSFVKHTRGISDKHARKVNGGGGGGYKKCTICSFGGP